jgi:hypothetical protein
VQQPFKNGQIVQVALLESALFAQVRSIVQRSETEILCWARPLVLRETTGFQDVRQAMDVIWPILWFTPAYDVELLDAWPFLDWEEVVYLGPSKAHLSLLQEFTQRLYQTKYIAPHPPFHGGVKP